MSYHTVPSNRPVSLTVMSIIGIVWGSLHVLFGLWGIVAYFITIGPGNAALERLKHDGIYIFSVFGIGTVAILLQGLLIGGCVGALQLRRWARPALLAYAGVYVAVMIVQMGIQYGYVMPQVMEGTMNTMRSTGRGAPPPGFEGIMKAAMLVGVCFGIVMALAMPTYVLIVMTRQRVRDAFNGIFPPANSYDGRFQQPGPRVG